jgi:signal transduction histidine kinase
LTNEINTRRRAEKGLTDFQEQLRALTHRMDLIAEEERTRIAREVHDELGHLLTAIKYDIDGLTGNPDLLSGHVKNELDSVNSMIESLIDTVRKIATELRPGILDHLGLFPAIEWQIKQFQKRTKICCHVDIHEYDITFSKDETTIIFRILQEILTNVARHSKASKVSITAKKKDDSFMLEVSDNGVGFDMKSINNLNSLGLLGMKERALSIGGEIRIVSSPGKGTTISLISGRN